MRTGIGIGIPFSRVLGGIDPQKIAGLQIWLKGDAGVTLVGGAVDSWADQSGNGQNCAAPAGINRPAYSATLNGRNVLTFNGTNSVLRGVLNNPLTFAGACSIFVVWRKNAVAPKTFETQISFGATGNASNNPLTMFSHQSGSARSNRIATDIWLPSGIEGSQSTTTSTAYSSSIRTSSIQNHRILANSKIKINGVNQTLSIYGASNPTALNNNPYQVGAMDYLALATSFFGGDIAEILVYNTNVSDADTLLIENYFLERWGV